MIHHISLPAADTVLAADVLSRIFDGKVTDFRPTDNAFMVWFGDDFGSAIEVYPADIELQPGKKDSPCTFHRSRTAEFSPVHAAISISKTAAEIFAIGEELGWRTKIFSRGSFRVIEFWIENRIMLELLTPDMAAEYLGMTEKYRKN